MSHSILKNHWERLKEPIALGKKTIEAVIAPYSSEAVEAVEWLSDGCANTNYKVSFKNYKTPVVLRLYTREESSVLREATLHRRLDEENIPVPEIYYEDSSCTLIDYPYAIMEWVDGILMRNIILSGKENELYECAFDAGKNLNCLRAIVLPEAGFFQENLVVNPFHEDEKYKFFVFRLLQHPLVQESLGVELHRALSKWIERYSSLVSNETEISLTHGDFDPANILVKKIDGEWKIVAILDWEFAFAGTYFVDMGMFLRYAHKLPTCYEEGFIHGLEAEGKKLPSTWKLKAKLIDLLSLLRLLECDSGIPRPNLNRDVVSLIAHTVTLK